MADHSAPLDNHPAIFVRVALANSALHGSLLLVGEPVGVSQLEAPQKSGMNLRLDRAVLTHELCLQPKSDRGLSGARLAGRSIAGPPLTVF
jgi:hypothetical protein